MSNKSRKNPLLKLSLTSLLCSAALVGCAVSAKNQGEVPAQKTVQQERSDVAASDLKNSPVKGRIKFAPDSPADTVRVFYKNLREKRFRDALMMTNLRPAIEGLTDAEINDLRSDFEPLAAQVPAEIDINGEIITNNQATVTAKMPNDETGVLELKEFKLRRETGAWTILMADEAAEAAAKKAGKNYFFVLRLDVHHSEAQAMMERVAKSQMVYALQNNGQYADMATLIQQNLLPPDAQNAESTGYRYNVQTSSDRKKYTATAEPAVYGKTGKLSYLLELSDKDQKARLKFEDNKGAPLKGKK